MAELQEETPEYEFSGLTSMGVEGGKLVYSNFIEQQEPQTALSPRQEPFQGPNELTIEDVSVGDVIRFVHEGAIDHRRTEHDVFVIGIDDETMQVQYLQGPSKKTVQVAHLTDRGLAPRTNRSGAIYWNSTNHTQRVPDFDEALLNPLSPESALGIQRLFAGIDESQARFGVEPTETTDEQLVLEALIDRALRE